MCQLFLQLRLSSVMCLLRVSRSIIRDRTVLSRSLHHFNAVRLHHIPEISLIREILPRERCCRRTRGANAVSLLKGSASRARRLLRLVLSKKHAIFQNMVLLSSDELRQLHHIVLPC